jgi:hypothetical protein
LVLVDHCLFDREAVWLVGKSGKTPGPFDAFLRGLTARTGAEVFDVVAGFFVGPEVIGMC